MLQNAFNVRHNVWLPENKLSRLDLGVMRRTGLPFVGYWRNSSVLRWSARRGAQIGSYTGMYVAHGLCIPLDACFGTRPLLHGPPLAGAKNQQPRPHQDALADASPAFLPILCASLGCRAGVGLAKLGQLYSGQSCSVKPTDGLPRRGKAYGYAFGAGLINLVRLPSWVCKLALPALGFGLGVVAGLMLGCLYCDFFAPRRPILADPPSILGL